MHSPCRRRLLGVFGGFGTERELTREGGRPRAGRTQRNCLRKHWKLKSRE